MRRTAILILGLMGPAAGAHAADLRCDGRLVGVGDTSHELRVKCGAPAHVATQTRLSARGTAEDLHYVRESFEVWTYPGGPGDLGRVVTVKRGRVASIVTLGKMSLQSNPSCERDLLPTGARVGTVRLRCGAPADRAVWEEERVIRRPGGLETRQLVVHETWTYDPGPGRLLRVLHFENSRLVRTETGHRSP